MITIIIIFYILLSILQFWFLLNSGIKFVNSLKYVKWKTSHTRVGIFTFGILLSIIPLAILFLYPTKYWTIKRQTPIK